MYCFLMPQADSQQYWCLKLQKDTSENEKDDLENIPWD